MVSRGAMMHLYPVKWTLAVRSLAGRSLRADWDSAGRLNWMKYFDSIIESKGVLRSETIGWEGACLGEIIEWRVLYDENEAQSMPEDVQYIATETSDNNEDSFSLKAIINHCSFWDIFLNNIIIIL